MGDAFLELSRKLSRSSFLSSPSLSFAPVIFLLSDGSPNDDWKKGLDTLKQNKWFQGPRGRGTGSGGNRIVVVADDVNV